MPSQQSSLRWMLTMLTPFQDCTGTAASAALLPFQPEVLLPCVHSLAQLASFTPSAWNVAPVVAFTRWSPLTLIGGAAVDAAAAGTGAVASPSARSAAAKMAARVLRTYPISLWPWMHPRGPALDTHLVRRKHADFEWIARFALAAGADPRCSQRLPGGHRGLPSAPAPSPFQGSQPTVPSSNCHTGGPPREVRAGGASAGRAG